MKLKQSDGMILIFGVFLFINILLSDIKIFSVLSIIILIMYWIYIASVLKKKILFKYIYITVNMSVFIVTLMTLEFKRIWLGELQEYSYFTGSICTLCFYLWLLYTLIQLVDKFWEQNTKAGYIKLRISNTMSGNWIIEHMPIIIFCINGILFLSVINKPFFIVGAEVRQLYSAKYMSHFINIIKILPSICIGVLLIPQIRKYENNIITLKHLMLRILLPYIPYVLFLVWTGSKFGEFWDLFCLILIPIICIVNFKNLNIKNLTKTILILIIAMSTFLLLYYHFLGKDLSQSIMTIISRLVCESELWWKTFGYVKLHGTNFHEFQMGLTYLANSFSTEGASKDFGVYHLMNLFADSSVLAYYKTLYIRFTSAGFELPYLYFGVFGLIIISFFYANMYSIFVNMYVNAVKEKRLLGSIASARLYQVMCSAVTQGDWWSFTSLISIGCIIIIFITYLKSRKKSVGG